MQMKKSAKSTFLRKMKNCQISQSAVVETKQEMKQYQTTP